MYGIFQGGHLGILHVGRKCHVSHQAVRNCVASCGYSWQTGEKQKKEKKKLPRGDRRFRRRHMVIIMTQRGKTLGYNLLTTYHMPRG